MDFGSGNRGRTRPLFPFPLTLTSAHALPLTDLPVGDASPGCIMHAIHPAQSQYHVHTRPLPPSNLTTSSSSRPPPVQQPQQNAREPVTVVAIPSVTVEYNQLIVGDARSCQFIPHALTRFHIFTPSFPLFLLSINTLLHSSKGRRRWIIRNSVVVRLARDVTPKYTSVRHAVRSGCTSRVRQQASRSRKEDEETMGRRLGRVQKAQGARGPSVSTTRSLVPSFFLVLADSHSGISHTTPT